MLPKYKLDVLLPFFGHPFRTYRHGQIVARVQACSPVYMEAQTGAIDVRAYQYLEQ